MASLLDLVRDCKVTVDADILMLHGNRTAYYNKLTGYVQLYFGCVNGVSDLRLLHRVILEPMSHQIIDHINRDRSDCTRINLRIASTELNSRNKTKSVGKTSSRLGISYRKDRDLWRAYGTVQDKYIHLGHFKTEQAAIEARERWLESVASIIA
jgi:hypothetical protein